MPLYTPSPHRFLASNPAPTQKRKPKPQSGLRNTSDAHFKTPVPAKRFVITPYQKRYIGDEYKKSEDETEQARVQQTPRPKPPRTLERIESIEETSQFSPPTFPDNGHHDYDSTIIRPIEHNRMFEPEAHQPLNEDEDDNDLLYTIEDRNKRRRISTPPTHHSDPSTPHPTTTTTTHRFLAPQQRTPAPFPTTTPHRPSFLLPPLPTSPQKPKKPLPEIFSPSRKNNKYVPSGMAATMQTFIIDAAHSGADTAAYARDADHGVKVRLRVCCIAEGVDVVECLPHGFVLVEGKGEGVSGEMERMVLVGRGGARGVVRIGRGDVIVVRGPVWDVDVCGEKWVVGVEWGVM
ncbi:hypothetical protein GQ44DRAFT_763017 [Phaeosphaeriaceae sp. PMI808]|nr:hypothetical protein GQ44DRAFT_763017 [Phaeosphaeriaceae sp. PMI808]